MAKYDHLKETLYKFYNNNRNLSRKEIFDKFHDLGAPYSLLTRIEQTQFEDKIEVFTFKLF